ncbi:MAG: hypothetical protein AAB928_00320 [Patescibacteria group bacterium]
MPKDIGVGVNHPPDNFGGRGVLGLPGQNHQLAAIASYQLLLLFGITILNRHKNIGAEHGDETAIPNPFLIHIFHKGYQIYAIQIGEHFHPFVLRIDGAVLAFVPFYRLVAISADNQNVAISFGLNQISYVTYMQKIPSADCDHDSSAQYPPSLYDPDQFVVIGNKFIPRRISIVSASVDGHIDLLIFDFVF